jgi:hypothetical protein
MSALFSSHLFRHPNNNNNKVYMGALVFWSKKMAALDETQAQAQSVPISVEYLIVRVGEWTMVMLGETVLSMLGVALQADGMIYGMFVCSMLIAGNLQFQGYMVRLASLYSFCSPSLLLLTLNWAIIIGLCFMV